MEACAARVMVGCAQPHLPGGRATIWLCGHYHASCMARTQAGTEVVTTGAAGGVINWSKPPQATATPPRHQTIDRSPPSSAALASSCVPTLCAPSPACTPHRCSPQPSSSSWVRQHAAVTCDAFNSGLRVCRVRRDRIDHRFLEFNAVPPTLDEVP